MSAPAKVLVVDDSATMRGLITAVLSADPEVSVIGQAGDALEAREAIKKLNPDVVTLDIEMPNMNGLEFLQQVKADAALSQIPVIIVSTEGKEEDTIRGLKLGAKGYVKKPFQASELHGLIEKITSG